MADTVAGGGPAQGTYGRYTGRKGSSGFCPSEGPICYTPQGVYPASLTPSTVSVCQDRKIWRSFTRDHSGLPSGATDE
jgi:hypothetical protein